MQPIQGTYHDGQIQWDTPPDWPEGQRVVIVPTNDETDEAPSQPNGGLEEKYWPNTPENNAEILRRIRSFEPWALTAEERAQWEADLKLSDEISKADNLKIGLDS